VSSLHRNSGTASSPALASQTDTSRLLVMQPAASYRGSAYDEPQAILHMAMARLAKCERYSVSYPYMGSCTERQATQLEGYHEANCLSSLVRSA
jgi:hypothetical protein